MQPLDSKGRPYDPTKPITDHRDGTVTINLDHPDMRTVAEIFARGVMRQMAAVQAQGAAITTTTSVERPSPENGNSSVADADKPVAAQRRRCRGKLAERHPLTHAPGGGPLV